MKKITLLLLTILMALTITGCGSKEEDVPTVEVKEPVAYSDNFLVLSNKVSALEELSGKTVMYSTKVDSEIMEYVVSEINKVVSEEIVLFDNDDYTGVPNVLDQVDAFILPEDVHTSILPDYRSDYKPKEFTILGEFKMPYYEEEVLDSSITSSDLYNKPFVVMIDGLDGEGDETKCTTSSNAYLRNDVNHLMIVDPTRNHITMISFPRDSYVLNTKTGRRDKLTHHGLNGVENIKASIGNLLDYEIPYYMQVSFGSFVHMINLFGGVRVDVPLDTYMDMDSNRDVRYTFSIPKGEQLLYGEEALALSRNRKYANIYNSDQGRLRNQALIITSLMEKITNHPRILEVAHANWWFKYVTCNNFNDSDLNVLVELAKKFSNEGYTVDNYFVDGAGDMAGDMYVLRLFDSSVEIAKGKLNLALNGEISPENEYYDEIMTGWINKGTGTYEVGYLGSEYDLHEIFGLSKPVAEVVNEEAASTNAQ